MTTAENEVKEKSTVETMLERAERLRQMAPRIPGDECEHGKRTKACGICSKSRQMSFLQQKENW